MQLICCVLMAFMTGLMAFSFLKHKEGLGAVELVWEEANYGLGLYLAAAGVTLFVGAVWSLWILTRCG